MKNQEETYSLFPSVTMSVFHTTAPQYIPKPHRNTNILEIMYCLSGRAECEMHDGCLQYIGEGDILISKSNNQSQKYELPLHNYSGILISIDLDSYPNYIFQTEVHISIDMAKILQKCFSNDSCFLVSAREATTNFFSMLSDISKDQKKSYYQIKFLELLVYLESINLENEKVGKTYNRRQVTIVKKSRKYLIEHIDKRITISHLANTFGISETTLKIVFKEIYGKPIFTFMKEYRMKEAKLLLKNSDYTISQISSMLGYETQSKFGATFKKSIGVSPNEYRNNHL